MEKLSIGGKTSRKTSDVKTGSWRTFKPIIDKKKCKGCGECIKVCPEAGMGMHEKEGQILAEINYDYCKGCMLCSSACPFNAIKAKKEKK
ncbi:hypothetical protein CL614_04845 [archaeon]|nr:hypothetical protein [archaeon]|tara:strand:- start:953 stop:1222 length:270 start_codon:yes stop_codon:yes gene_type:complete